MGRDEDIVGFDIVMTYPQFVDMFDGRRELVEDHPSSGFAHTPLVGYFQQVGFESSSGTKGRDDVAFGQ